MRDIQAVLQRASFLAAAGEAGQFPPDSGAEVAFVGRSNSGKSSAINALTGRRALARTSKTPGRTQQIVFFDLDEDRRLVDLPGYGYAKVAAQVHRQWQPLIEGYLRQRRSLRGLMLIVDCRRDFADYERQILQWCRAAGMPVHVLLTKSDKLKRGAAQEALRRWRAALEAGADGSATPSAQLFSATSRGGVDEARARLGEWLADRQKKAPVQERGRDNWGE